MGRQTPEDVLPRPDKLPNTARHMEPEMIDRPDKDGWDPSKLVMSILRMRDTAFRFHAYGPFILCHSPMWQQHFDATCEIKTADDDGQIVDRPGERTVGARVKLIEGIHDMLPFPALHDFDLALVQVETSKHDTLTPSYFGGTVIGETKPMADVPALTVSQEVQP